MSPAPGLGKRAFVPASPGCKPCIVQSRIHCIRVFGGCWCQPLINLRLLTVVGTPPPPPPTPRQRSIELQLLTGGRRCGRCHRVHQSTCTPLPPSMLAQSCIKFDFLTVMNRRPPALGLHSTPASPFWVSEDSHRGRKQ
jgi:hypothetical protein